MCVKIESVYISSRLARALWIEIDALRISSTVWYRSRLARALWIEINRTCTHALAVIVEARESLVD